MTAKKENATTQKTAVCFGVSFFPEPAAVIVALRSGHRARYWAF
jgi:hypothetical protein